MKLLFVSLYERGFTRLCDRFSRALCKEEIEASSLTVTSVVLLRGRVIMTACPFVCCLEHCRKVKRNVNIFIIFIVSLQICA